MVRVNSQKAILRCRNRDAAVYLVLISVSTNLLITGCPNHAPAHGSFP